MFPQPPPPGYHDHVNPALLRAVPADAMRILDVGCGSGGLGVALKQAVPGRTVFGVERNPAAAARARERLDAVFELDVERVAVPLPTGTLDCVTFGDVLEHLVDPEAVLRRVRPLLRSAGCVVCSVPNVQHHTVLSALLRGDFPYAPAGLLDATHLRFFTYASFLKLLLDAGYAPDIVGRSVVPADPALVGALEPALRFLGLDPQRTRQYLDAYQYMVAGYPLADADDPGEEVPVTFACYVNDEAVLRENLLGSPDLAHGHPHEVLLVHGAATAADGLNAALEQARHDLVVAVHQDVYLPRGWVRRLVREVRAADRRFGPVGVAGVYGRAGRGPVGRVVDRDRLLGGPSAFPPTPADTLDELVLVVSKRSGLRFDATFGWHLYGADLCRTAKRAGLAVAAVDAICLHNSRTVHPSAAYADSERVLVEKWTRVI